MTAFGAGAAFQGLSRAEKSSSAISGSRANASWVFVVCWSVPPILIALFIWLFAVDVPVWDDLFIGQTILNAQHEGFTLTALVAQHNESRPAFPRLLFSLISGATQSDVRWQMAASVGVLLATGLVLIRICRGTIDNPLAATVTAVLVNFMLFSPVQWANLLWGIQLIVFVPALSLVIGMWCLGSGLELCLSMWIAAAAALVATYSNSNGMLVWPLLAPFLLIHPSPRRLRALTAWTVMALVTIGSYFHDYHPVPGHPPMSLVLGDCKDSVLFFLAFLGNALRPSLNPMRDVPLGGAVMAVWMAGAIYLIASGRNLRLWRKAMPWLVLGAYALTSAALTTLGRFGFGARAAICERYCTFAIPLWYSVVPLWIVIFGDAFAREPLLRRVAMFASSAAAVVIAGLMTYGCFFVRQEVTAYHWHLLAARSAAQFALVAPDDDAIQSTIYPQAAFARQMITALDEADLFHPQCFRTSDVSAIAAGCNGGNCGCFDSLAERGPSLICKGWACIPAHQTLADAVLLTTRDSAGIERVFAIATDDRLTRPDVAKALTSPELEASGWSKTIDTHSFSHGAKILAWAFDSYNRRAYRLNGEQVVP